MKTTSACFRCQNFWHLNKWPPTSAEKKISQTPKVDSPPQTVCSTCVKYQLNLKTKEDLLQIKIKDLRSIVRELVLGVKGKKKDNVIQVLLRHAPDCSFKQRSAVTLRSMNIQLRRFASMILSFDNQFRCKFWSLASGISIPLLWCSQLIHQLERHWTNLHSVTN